MRKVALESEGRTGPKDAAHAADGRPEVSFHASSPLKDETLTGVATRPGRADSPVNKGGTAHTRPLP